LDSNNSILSIRRRLSFLLAKAACEVFPDAQTVEAQATDKVFYADICFTQKFDKIYLPLIQERFVNLLKNDIPIEHREMVPASARGVLKKAGQNLQARRLPSHPQLLLGLSIHEDFALISPQIEENTDRFFWELLGAYEGGTVGELVVTRLIGIAHEDLASIKSSKKFWARQPYIPIEKLVTEEKFLMSIEQLPVWLPKGERLRRDLQEMWEKLLLNAGFQIVSTGGQFIFEEDAKVIASLIDDNNLCLAESAFCSEENEEFQREGILTPLRGWRDWNMRICPKEKVRESCISSLQFILQIPRMLSFNARVILCTSLSGETKDLRAAADALGVDYCCEIETDSKQSSIKVQISDRIGRWWTLSTLWIEKKHPMQGRRAIFTSCFGKWERLIGLLLEKCESKLIKEELSLEQLIGNCELHMEQNPCLGPRLQR